MIFELKGVEREQRRQITSKLLPITLQFSEPYTLHWQVLDSDVCNAELNDGDTKAIDALANVLEEMQITYRMV